MGWHDDDPDDTNPNALVQGQPARPQHQQPHPQQQHPQQQHPQQQHPQQQHPQQQPWPQQQFQQQPPNVGGMPMTGQFAQAPRPHAQQPVSGGAPIMNPSGSVPVVNRQASPSGAVPVLSAPVVRDDTPVGSPSTAVPVLAAPVVAVEEEAQASRVVYGLSGTAVGGTIGTLLGMLNTELEGIPTTEGLDFILNSALWSAFLLGALCFLKPERFARALAKFTDNDD